MNDADSGAMHPVPLIASPLEIVFAVVTLDGIEERRFTISAGAHFRVPSEGEEVSLPLAEDDPIRELPDFNRSSGYFNVWSVCTDYGEGHFWVELHFTRPSEP